MNTLMNTIRLFALILCIALVNTAAAKASAQRIIYLGDPLKITLGVDQERRLTFPDSKLVWADVKDKMKSKLDAQVVGKNVYFKAKEQFKPTRIIVGEEGGSRVYLLDVQATDKQVGQRRIIVVEGEDSYAIADKDKEEPETLIKPLRRLKKTPSAGFKTLFQYAAAEVYAPERLRPNTSGLYSEVINKRPTYHLYRFNQLLTQPIAAWRSGGLHVSAIKVQNKTKQNLGLDPRLLRGRWKAALFYHNQLTPAGSPNDTTTLFLISDKPYVDAIRSNPMIKIGRR